jgi:hypothetical protein
MNDENSSFPEAELSILIPFIDERGSLIEDLSVATIGNNP